MNRKPFFVRWKAAFRHFSDGLALERHRNGGYVYRVLDYYEQRRISRAVLGDADALTEVPR